jgi:hypothetical protein
MVKKATETRKARYYTIELKSGISVKLTHFKVSEKVRIEFYKHQYGALWNLFMDKHVRGEVYKVGEAGFITKSPRTQAQFNETVKVISNK